MPEQRAVDRRKQHRATKSASSFATISIDACVRLARTWRNSRDARDTYVNVANKVEQELR
jgi:hypothetical protein